MPPPLHSNITTSTLKQPLICKDQQTFQKHCHYLKYNDMQKVLTWDQIGHFHSSWSSHPLSCLSLVRLQRLLWDRLVSPVTQSRPKQIQKIDRSFLIMEELQGGNVFIPSIWRQVKRWGWKIWALVGGNCLLNFFLPSPSFFIGCCLIYSGLRWHRGLESACCQTKPPQCSQCYSDHISALTPMRSPQCYVSPTEKYSHTEKDAVLWVEVLLYWCCPDKGDTHTHAMLTHLQTCTKGADLSPLGFFFSTLMGFWGLASFFRQEN